MNACKKDFMLDIKKQSTVEVMDGRTVYLIVVACAYPYAYPGWMQTYQSLILKESADLGTYHRVRLYYIECTRRIRKSLKSISRSILIT